MPQIFNGSLVDGLLDALAAKLRAVPELIEECTVSDVRFYLEALVTDAATDNGPPSSDAGSVDDDDDGMDPAHVEAMSSEEALRQSKFGRSPSSSPELSPGECTIQMATQ